MTRKWAENGTINEEIMDCPKMLHIEHAYSPLGVHFRGCESDKKMGGEWDNKLRVKGMSRRG